MKLSAPRQITWLIAVVVGGLGILGNFASVPVVSPNAFWFVTGGFALLVVATLFKDV
jgi:hypothetical protein